MMRKASWIVLTIVALLILLFSLGSVSLAYLGPAESIPIASTNFQELAAGSAEVEMALRGQRGTAAAFALAFGVLLLMVVTGPYRRGRLWAWWAILLAFIVFTVATAARVVFVGTQLGVSTALILFVITFVGLLLDFGRLSRPQ